MKQSSFWDKQEIVRDREKILAYLALCKRILAGGTK